MQFPKEQVMQAYDAAPSFVRDAFNAEKTTEFLVSLRGKYGFHIDIADVLGQQVGYLLLGLVSPSDFYRNIIAAGMPEDTARKVAEEINQHIFMPLNQGLKAGNMETVRQPVPPPPAVTTPAPPAPMIVRTLPPLGAVPPKAPTPPAPAPTPLPRPAPPVPQNLPGAVPEAKPAGPIPAPQPVRPVKAYAVDPYRELPEA